MTFCMSLYSVGKNEIRSLLEKETQIKNELRDLDKGSSNGICSFRAILLNNEMKKIRNKLKVLSLGNPSGSDDIS